MICERGDIVVIPFPFAARVKGKRRPALVISTKAFNEFGHTVLSMITSQGHQPWPGDILVKGYSEAGLAAPCVVRLKLFTLENGFIMNRIGRLSSSDRDKLEASSRLYISSGFLNDYDFLVSEHDNRPEI